jgi:uncharacterized protein
MTLSAMMARIQSDQGLQALMELARSRDDGDPGHDVAHALRVAVWTLSLELDTDPREAIAAALLHDAVNVPKDSPARARASVLSAELAAAELPKAGFSPEATIRICEAIEDHSFSRGATPRSVLGRALQDADRLEALGALGVLRTASCGAKLGARFSDPLDPWAQQRPLDDTRYTVDHFFTKLLTLEGTMQTCAGRAEARRRTDFLRAFLAQLAEELDIPLPTERLPAPVSAASPEE